MLERRLELTDGAEVLIQFDPPEPDGADFRCTYRIVWPDGTREAYGMGVDAIQALILAMKGAHSRLLASPEYKEGTLTWLGMRNLGLPVASIAADLIEGERV